MGFGANYQTDAFFVANFIPALLWSVLFATIGSAFMPMYVDTRQRSAIEADRLANEAVVIYGVAALVMAFGCILFAGTIVALTAPNASPQTKHLAESLTSIMAVGFLFTGYVGVQNAVQQANGRMLPPLFVPVTNNLAAVIGGLVAAWLQDITYAVICAVAIWVLQVPLQYWYARDFHRSRWTVRVRRETLQRLTAISLPLMAGVLLDQLNIYIGIALAAGLGEGAVSHLSYANRLAFFISGLFSTLISYLLFPSLAASASREEHDRVGRLLAIGCTFIMVLTVPVVLTAIIFRHDVVAVAFGRDSFRPEDVAQTSEIFGFFAYGVVFVSLRDMLNRVLFSYRKTGLTMLAGVLATTVNVLVSLSLSRTMGLSGIAIGATIATLVFVSVQILACNFWRPAVITRPLFVGALVVLLVTIPTALMLVALRAEVVGLPIFLRLAAATVCSFLVFGLGVLICGLVLGYRYADVRILR